MYRNCIHKVIDSQSKIILFGWDTDGKRVQFPEIDFNPYFYKETKKDSLIKSIYKTNLEKITFDNVYFKNKYIERNNIKRSFYNISPVQQFLIDNFYQEYEKPEFTQYPLKTWFLDIETTATPYENSDIVRYKIGDNIQRTTLGELKRKKEEFLAWDGDKNEWVNFRESKFIVSEGFPEPRIAPNPINIITIYDSLEKKFVSWGLGKYSQQDFPDITIECYNYTHEKDLLLGFLNYISKDYPDIISGWNSDSFDIPYLINRMVRRLGEDKTRLISPIGNFYPVERANKNGMKYPTYVIEGISCVDYMLAYMKFVPDPRERYSLDYIGQLELGKSKHKFELGDIFTMADENFGEFAKYNVQDVNLLVELDDKLRFIELLRRLAIMGLTQIENALKTVSVVTGACAIMGKKLNKVIPTFYRDENIIPNIEGGFVREVTKGLFKGICSFDANSLYPNLVITLNLSPETKVGELKEGCNGYDLYTITGKAFHIPYEKKDEFFKKNQLSLSKHNIAFSQKEKGLCALVNDFYYQERVKIRKESENLEKTLSTMDKNDINYKKLHFEQQRLDIIQYTIKIFLNSIYGTFCNRFFCMFDEQIANSITLSGQAAAKKGAEIIHEYFKRELPDIELEKCVIAGDTDSLYLTIESLLEKKNIELLDNGKVSSEAFRLVNDIGDNLNREINIWATQEMYSTDSRLLFKRETICKAGMFTEKKYYALNVIKKDNIDCNTFKYKGLQIVKSTFPPKIKKILKDLIESIISGIERDVVSTKINQWKEEFFKMDVNDIALNVGINAYNKYADKAVGLELVSETPYAVGSAINHNYLIDSLGLKSKYFKLKGGDKIRLVYLQLPNPYNIKTVGYLGKFPEEFSKILHVDYDLMFKKTIEKPIEGFFEDLNWNYSSPINVVTSLEELFG